MSEFIMLSMESLFAHECTFVYQLHANIYLLMYIYNKALQIKSFKREIKF